MKLKNLIAWPLARLFYFTGDFICKALDSYIEITEEYFFFDQCNDENVDSLYWFYSELMGISILFDDWGDTKLWSEPVSLE